MDELLVFQLCKDMAGGYPSEIQVIPYGRHDTPKGPFVLEEADAQAVLQAFEGQKNQMVIDYEHQTFADPPVEAPAAGWIRRLINKGADGIWAVVDWTERAKQYLTRREYRYVSPVFLKKASDSRVTRLINVALTNAPNIDGMVPLINRMLDLTQKEVKRTETPLWRTIAPLLGLGESATEAGVIKAIKALKMKNRVAASMPILRALGLGGSASESEIIGTINAMKHAFSHAKGAEEQVSSLSARLTDKTASDSVESAMMMGKITPAQREWALQYAKTDPRGFDLFIGKAPVTMIFGRVVRDQKNESGSAIDHTQQRINELCGVDTATFNKYSPKDEGL